MIYFDNKLLIMDAEAVRNYLYEDDEPIGFNYYLNKLEPIVSEKIVNDERFIKAVGKERAKKMSFFFDIVDVDNDDETKNTFIMLRSCGNPFTMEYMSEFYPKEKNGIPIEPAYHLMEDNGRMVKTMVFEYTGENGSTDPKTLQMDNIDTSLEEIVEEILADFVYRA